MENQHSKKESKRQHRGNRCAARNRSGNASDYHQGGVAEKNSHHWLKPARDGERKSERQQQFQKTSEMIWTNVSARSAMSVLGKNMPNSGRVRQELIKRVSRNPHCEKNEREGDELYGF